jgi:hypothetical protein
MGRDARPGRECARESSQIGQNPSPLGPEVWVTQHRINYSIVKLSPPLLLRCRIVRMRGKPRFFGVSLLSAWLLR